MQIILLTVTAVLALLIPGAKADTLFKRADGAVCPANSPLSCSAAAQNGPVDTCCVDSPGGYVLQTQFWDAVGPADSFTIHGLWPDNCNGTYQAFCDPNRAYTNISAILTAGGAQSTLDYMSVYWKDGGGNDDSFYTHEWSKHGTCMSTFDPTCYGKAYVPQEEVVQYFERTVDIFKSLPTYKWLTGAGIYPSTTVTYTLAQLQDAAKANFGQEAVWSCTAGSLDQVWYGYTVRGTIATGLFVPAPVIGSGGNCPATGIKWLPKTSSGTTTTTFSSTTSAISTLSSASTSTTASSSRSTISLSSTTTTPSSTYSSVPSTTATTSTSTVSPSSTSTKAFIKAVQSGKENGCLISTGKWMVDATCAKYKILKIDSSHVNLSTSKGACVIKSNVFTCGEGIQSGLFTINSAGNLVHGGRQVYYAQQAPSGTKQAAVLGKKSTLRLKLHLDYNI